MTPTTLIIRTSGTNCDQELARAFELAGSEPHTVHLNTLIAEPEQIGDAHIIAIPGGFSYGDDIAAGRILANRLRLHLLDAFRDAIDRSVPMIGICNGFQVLLKMGLLPDPAAATQAATLSDNETGRFIDRWVGLRVPAGTKCIWTRGLDSMEHLELPIAHGEGRFVIDASLLASLQAQGQVAVRYADNPNGSVGDVAGICDPSGLVFGLMPHPERYVHATQHPAWTRRAARDLPKSPPGLRMIQNAVAYAAGEVAAGKT